MNERGQYGNVAKRTHAAIMAGPDTIEPRFAAMRRAVKAIFYLHDRVRAPIYVYAEVNGVADASPMQSDTEAYARMAAFDRMPGEVYTAVFFAEGPAWPDPMHQTYHAALPDRLAVAGLATNARGQYGSGVAVGRLYHSVGDREDAVKQMDLDWTALFQDLAVQAGELTRDPNSSSGYHVTSQIEFDALKPDPKKIAWWKSYAKPRFGAWVKFRSDQLGQDATVAPNYLAWTERFTTDWSTYEEWKDKLDALRAAAQQAGFTLGAPAAQSLPTTVWQDAGGAVQKGAGAVASGIGDVWTLLKYGMWGALGIGAVIALSSVASNLRSGRDPAEKYVELIRDRRRTARTALPGAARLALPAGAAA